MFSASPTPDSLAEISGAILASGTTNYMLTLATNSLDVFHKAIRVAAENPHPTLLGLHLEGPYLNAEKRGAHPAELIRKPEREEIEELLSEDNGMVKIMTIAPELFDRDTVRWLLGRGVRLSAGHSAATLEEGIQAFQLGIPMATHLFNAMPPLHHREPGLVGAVYTHNSVLASIIADGIHVHYEALRISKQIMGNRLFLITDAVTDVNVGPYQHVFNRDRYILPDGTLSGSSLTLLQAVANCVRYAGIPLDEALRMATRYPARVMGLDGLGEIRAGYKANLVLFDSDFQVKRVMLEGEWVF